MDRNIASLEADASLQDAPEEFFCPIAQEMMTDQNDPVIVDATCMQTVGRQSLKTWLDMGKRTCPDCGSKLRSTTISPNVPLRRLIERFVGGTTNVPTSATASAPSSASSINSGSEATSRNESSSLAHSDSTTASTLQRHCRSFRDCGVWGEYFGGLNDDGQRHGEGTMKWENGNSYKGEWKGGKSDGQGTFQYASGSVYEGEWKDGKREGQGTFRFANGTVYEGPWKDQKREGYGTYRYANGESYEGGFKDGKRDGQGTYLHANGNVYEGGFKDGKREGKGTVLFANGDVYEGGWKGGKKEGQGTFRSRDGQATVGRYLAGKPIGEGVRWSSDRRVAHRLDNGDEKEKISLEEAAAIAARIGLPVPENLPTMIELRLKPFQQLIGLMFTFHYFLLLLEKLIKIFG